MAVGTVTVTSPTSGAAHVLAADKLYARAVHAVFTIGADQPATAYSLIVSYAAASGGTRIRLLDVAGTLADGERADYPAIEIPPGAYDVLVTWTPTGVSPISPHVRITETQLSP